MKKINLNVPVNSLGYGVVGYNIWKEFNKIQDVTLWPIPDANHISPPHQIDQDTVYQIRIDVGKQHEFAYDAPCLKIWHENQLEYSIGRGPFFAFPFFEVNVFNQRRKTHLSSADEIIVASDWAKNVLEKNEFTQPIHVVECGVDRTIFNEGRTVPESNKCIFFNCGKWEVRKGHDVLWSVFESAFSQEDDVELWMMTENPFLTDEEKNTWLKLYNKPNIKMINRVDFQEQLAEIMSNTYCGIFPSKSEGWNLEALEMMACGKHVIITDYSAHTQFCNDKNSMLVDIKEEEPAYDGKWFTNGDGTWASLDGDPYDQMVEHMRSIYEQWKTDRSCNTEGIATSKELTWARSAKKISEIILGE